MPCGDVAGTRVPWARACIVAHGLHRPGNGSAPVVVLASIVPPARRPWPSWIWLPRKVALPPTATSPAIWTAPPLTSKAPVCTPCCTCKLPPAPSAHRPPPNVLVTIRSLPATAVSRWWHRAHRSRGISVLACSAVLAFVD